MTIGLNSEEIKNLLREKSSVQSEDLFEAIAQIMTENNKKIKEYIDEKESGPAIFG